MKSDFLVLHDYGMGGVWAVLKARSKNEIVKKYPMLKPRDDKPTWMTSELYNQVRASRCYDIDDELTGWLRALVASENSKAPGA